MDAAAVARVVAEVERRWRARTPPTRADEVNASYRVGRGEIRAWCGAEGVALDETDPGLEVALLRLYARLAREFPGEWWDVLNARMRATAKAHGVAFPRSYPR